MRPGLAAVRQAVGLLDRPQHVVVVDRRAVPARATCWPAMIVAMWLALPPSSSSKVTISRLSWVMRPPGVPGQMGAQPGVAGADRAVVHVVAQVGDDEGHGRQRWRSRSPRSRVKGWFTALGRLLKSVHGACFRA